jgi:phosphoglycerate dehydrogenase-like enzyme
MITIAVPDQHVATALGDVGAGARVVIWNASEGDAPDDERDAINLACIPHYSGGRKLYARLAHCPNLRVIQIPSAGFEHALPFVPPGVALANARGVHDTRVAEMTLALALATIRDLPHYLEAQSRHAWEQRLWGPSLADQRALIVGYGSIGKAIAARLRACEVEVEGVGTTSRVEQDGTVVHSVATMATALANADIVIAVLPSSATTDGLVDAEFLANMKDGALLINVGRGPVVDTPALLAELQAGRLRAALDVTDPEPLPQDHPLWDAPGCIIVPHVAGSEPLDGRRYTDLVHRQIDALVAGQDAVNVVAVGAR